MSSPQLPASDVRGQFQRLDAHAVASTLDRLHERIIAHFPERNIGRVAAETLTLGLSRKICQKISLLHAWT